MQRPVPSHVARVLLISGALVLAMLLIALDEAARAPLTCVPDMHAWLDACANATAMAPGASPAACHARDVLVLLHRREPRPLREFPLAVGRADAFGPIREEHIPARPAPDEAEAAPRSDYVLLARQADLVVDTGAVQIGASLFFADCRVQHVRPPYRAPSPVRPLAALLHAHATQRGWSDDEVRALADSAFVLPLVWGVHTPITTHTLWLAWVQLMPRLHLLYEAAAAGEARPTAALLVLCDLPPAAAAALDRALHDAATAEPLAATALSWQPRTHVLSLAPLGRGAVLRVHRALLVRPPWQRVTPSLFARLRDVAAPALRERLALCVDPGDTRAPSATAATLLIADRGMAGVDPHALTAAARSAVVRTPLLQPLDVAAASDFRSCEALRASGVAASELVPARLAMALVHGSDPGPLLLHLAFAATPATVIVEVLNASTVRAPVPLSRAPVDAAFYARLAAHASPAYEIATLRGMRYWMAPCATNASSAAAAAAAAADDDDSDQADKDPAAAVADACYALVEDSLAAAVSALGDPYTPYPDTRFLNIVSNMMAASDRYELMQPSRLARIPRTGIHTLERLRPRVDALVWPWFVDSPVHVWPATDAHAYVAVVPHGWVLDAGWVHDNASFFAIVDLHAKDEWVLRDTRIRARDRLLPIVRFGPGVVLVNLVNEWSSLYYHFWAETLPRLLLALRAAGGSFVPGKHVLLLSRPSLGYIREALALLGLPDAAALYHEYQDNYAYHAETVWLPRPSRFYTPSAEGFAELFARLVPNPPPMSARNLAIWMRRTHTRQLLNEDAVRAELQATFGADGVHEFVVFDDSQPLTVRQTIALFSRASFVFGASGAGFINLLFTPADTGVVVLENVALGDMHQCHYHTTSLRAGTHWVLLDEASRQKYGGQTVNIADLRDTLALIYPTLPAVRRARGAV